MSLLTELGRRNVIRMAGLYLVGAWLVVQVAETVLPAFDVPDWVLRALIILLAIGFVPALVVSWVFELTPEGLKRDRGPEPEKPLAARTGRRMDRMLLAGLALVAVLVLADRFWPAAETGSETGAASHSPAAPAPANAPAAAGSGPGPVSSARPPAAQSIAVLAFADLSPGRDQEYFSDGMAEEILNALAQVPGLKVTGRTSSFHFKGRDEDLRTIGEVLGVQHILEGSVRKQGNQVRISAQLIQASDGFHLWSETYDGELDDVFELQEGIARAIAGKLKLVLQGDPSQRLVTASTTSPEAYEKYLQATAVINRRQAARFDEALAQLQEAVALDPGFARAHARMALLYFLKANYGLGDPASLREAIEREARRALELDPRMAEPHALLGAFYTAERRYAEASGAYERALAIEPNDATSLYWLAIHQVLVGYLAESSRNLDLALKVDPLFPSALIWRCYGYEREGRLELAEKYCRLAMDAGLPFGEIGLALLSHRRGDTALAIDQMARGMVPLLVGYPEGSAQVIARGMFGDGEARARALALIDGKLARDPAADPGIITFPLLWMGRTEQAFDLVVDGQSNTSLWIYLWGPGGRDLRRTPDFLAFARRTGLVEFWDDRGAPDLCPRNEAGDYACL